MDDIFRRIAYCIERGKSSQQALYPPDMRGQAGAAEWTEKALEAEIPASEILDKGLVIGMHNIGEKFSKGEAFIPDLLIAAQAMNAAMEMLKPYFDSGETHYKGTFVIGTVAGDLHDIGKNIVRMVMEGAGWKVIDLGTNVSTENFLKAIDEYPGPLVGMSALLTTTMVNMEKSVREIKANSPQVKIFIGGAPVTDSFSTKIGADAYFPDPHELVDYLKRTKGEKKG